MRKQNCQKGGPIPVYLWFETVTHNISDYFHLTSVSIFSTLFNKILSQEEKIQITLINILS